MAYFKCLACAYIHEGTEAPERCPICCSPSSNFKLLDEETSMKISQANNNVVSKSASSKPSHVGGTNDAAEIIEMYESTQGGKLQVVQWYKEKYKLSLADAKNRVDEVLEAKYHFNSGNKKGGCMTAILIAITSTLSLFLII